VSWLSSIVTEPPLATKTSARVSVEQNSAFGSGPEITKPLSVRLLAPSTRRMSPGSAIVDGALTVAARDCVDRSVMLSFDARWQPDG
jgi:hypothetical protein